MIPTKEEMQKRIAMLEATIEVREINAQARTLVSPSISRDVKKAITKARKAKEKARKAQFRLDAQRRRRLSSSLNRYYL